jgi:hypothetical protein
MHLLGIPGFGNLVIHRIHIVVAVYIYIGSIRDLERLSKEVIIDVGYTGYSEKEARQG